MAQRSKEVLDRILGRQASAAVVVPEAIIGQPAQTHWLLQQLPVSYHHGFLHSSVGTIFGGEVDAIAAYILDVWGTRGRGLEWYFAPGPALTLEAPEPILERCLVQTKEAVLRRAVLETDSRVDLAIVRSLMEQLDAWGFKDHA